MIMSETDAPYVAPVPYRGKRNEPVYVREVVKKIAEIKFLSESEVAKIIVQNAKRLFDIQALNCYYNIVSFELALNPVHLGP